MKRLLTAFALGMLVMALLPLTADSAQTDERAKSVILLIGDGMGPNHVALGQIYAEQVLGRDLAISGMEHQASTTTDSASSSPTDSAAAGSALQSGFKFKNDAINVLPDGQPTYTLGQAAHDAGKAVGIVTTTRITHATPATVYGHTPDRRDESLLALQMVEFAPEVALGGGWREFVPEDQKGRREDGRDLLAELQAAGWTIVPDPRALAGTDLGATQRLLGLFAKSDMAFEIDRINEGKDQPSLAEMTRAAIAVLERDSDGFYLVVEGGRIDHAAHVQDAASVVHEVIAFDEAVRVALDFAASRPDVLVIVTADHETGGLTLGGPGGSPPNPAALQPVTCSVGRFNSDADAQNVLALADSCGFGLSAEDRLALANFNPDDGEESAETYGAESLAHWIVVQRQSADAGVAWEGWSHTHQPVTTYAAGPGAEAFTGSLDNTNVPRLIAALTGLTIPEPVAMPAAGD